MTNYARWVWEVEILNKPPTAEDMKEAMDTLIHNITSYLTHPSIEDIEICETPYEIWGEGFEEAKL